jgi:hypothetical protein
VLKRTMSSSDLASSVNSSSTESISISSASSAGSSLSEVATIGTELSESTQDHTGIKSTQETAGITTTLDSPDTTTTLASDIPKTTQNNIPDPPADGSSTQEMSSSLPIADESSSTNHAEDGVTSPTAVTSKPPVSGTTKKTTNPPVTTKASGNVNSRPASPAKTPVPTSAPRSSTIIQAVKGENSAVTSTITDQPSSTFASLVGVQVTNADGSTTLSFPPLVTVLSTSQEANGSYVTWTHVVANPTGFLSVDGASNSFFSKAGQVAGVFLVVGIVAASLMVFLFVSCRRRRARYNRRKRWLSGIQRPLPIPDDPFEDPRDPPSMWAVNDGVSWDGRRRTLIDNENPTPMSTDGPTNGLGLSGVGPEAALTHGGGYNPGYNLLGASYEQNMISLAVSTNRDGGQSRPSLAQSSPSIYPPTLPAHDEDGIVYEDIDMGPPTLSRSPSSGAPPRPPRSHLRDSVVKGSEYFPMTPPPSVSSHGHSDPFADPSFSPSSRPSSAHIHKAVQEDIFNRRTILDVRARPSRDNL